MSVLDASLWLEVAVQRQPVETLPAPPILVPGHFDGEVLSGLRGLVSARELSKADGLALAKDLRSAALLRVALRELVEKAWPLSTSVSTYDAFYVALARREQAALFTCDAKLAAGAADLCDVHLVS